MADDHPPQEHAAIALDEANAAWLRFFENMDKDGFRDAPVLVPIAGMFMASLTSVYLTTMLENYGPNSARMMREHLINHLNNSRKWL